MGFPGRSRFVPGECLVGCTGTRSQAPGTQVCGAVSWGGGGGGVALQSRAPPALPRSPPLLTTLYTDVRGYRTYGDQLTGKRRQRSQPRVGCARAIVQCCLLTAGLSR